MEKTEATLWRDFRNGDRDAFESLLNLFYSAMFEYGSRYQKDPDKLRDALHNLMISLWERRRFLNETTNLKLYLFKAMRHQIFREKHEASSLTVITEQQENEYFQHNDYAESDIIEGEVLKETASKIKNTVDKLSKRQQEILHLKFYENLSNEQISELLGISRPAVANLLYQTLKTFRTLWQSSVIQLLLLINFTF